MFKQGDLDCPWDPIGGAESDNIVDTVTPSSVTTATIASISGSDGSISKFSIDNQTSPQTMQTSMCGNLTMVDLHANHEVEVHGYVDPTRLSHGYVNGSLLFTVFRHRTLRNATTQSKSLPIDSDNLDLYGRAADPQYADEGSHERCSHAVHEEQLNRM